MTTTATTIVTPYTLNAKLVAPLLPTDTTLPLSGADAGSLSTLLGLDGHAWLTIFDPTGSEVVKATAWVGQILVERGQGGSTARTFPTGSCVDARVTYAGVKDLLCNYDCCKKGDCT